MSSRDKAGGVAMSNAGVRGQVREVISRAVTEEVFGKTLNMLLVIPEPEVTQL